MPPSRRRQHDHTIPKTQYVPPIKRTTEAALTQASYRLLRGSGDHCVDILSTRNAGEEQCIHPMCPYPRLPQLSCERSRGVPGPPHTALSHDRDPPLAEQSDSSARGTSETRASSSPHRRCGSCRHRSGRGTDVVGRPHLGKSLPHPAGFDRPRSDPIRSARRIRSAILVGWVGCPPARVRCGVLDARGHHRDRMGAVAQRNAYSQLTSRGNRTGRVPQRGLRERALFRAPRDSSCHS